MNAATAAASKPALRRRPRFGNRGGLAGYLFVAPSIILLITFVIFPSFLAAYYSVSDYDLMSPPRIVGFKRFGRLMDDDRYCLALANTLYFAVGTVPTGIVTSLLLAAVINRSIRGIYTFRALF